MSVPQEATYPDTGRSPSTHSRGAPPSGWVLGLSVFAGAMMIITGLFNAMEGLVALARNEIYVASPRYIFAFDLTTWGWIHVILGLVVLAAGFAVIVGKLWGRVVGITVAVLSMLANFAFLPAYPVWSLVLIALDALVIYALIAHGREIHLP